MTQLHKVRKSILKQRGVELAPHTRKPVPYDELPVPYIKTNLMKLLELKHSQRIEELISKNKGTIYQVAKQLDIDASTVSKWRTLIADANFWENFWHLHIDT